MRNSSSNLFKSLQRFLAITFVVVFLAGCEGDQGVQGEAGTIGLLSAESAKTLAITIDSVEVNGAAVVSFTAKDDSGVPIAGLTSANLRFGIAKLVPGSFGSSSDWQSYINRSAEGKAVTAVAGSPKLTNAIQATTESNGLLEDLGKGEYTYTFATDITNVTSPLEVSYQPGLTHRVAIQVGSFPASNPIYDFRPDGAAVTAGRDIVKTENCNSCHNKLAMHGGGRVETQYCVVCHNTGSTDPETGNTVDFKVLVHKLHRGENLPSVKLGPDLEDGTADDGTGSYSIVGFRSSVHEYSDLGFPQDIRNCTKCHDGSDAEAASYAPQGDNWKSVVNMETCGSCHDNIDFSKDGIKLFPTIGDPNGHSGGAQADNTNCTLCHGAGKQFSAETVHAMPAKVAGPKFQYNILNICGTDVDADPVCAPNSTPTVTFSVTDPTGATTHGYGNSYDVAGATVGVDKDPEFGASASLNVLTGWDTRDYTNEGGSGSRPARADSTGAISNAVDNGDGTFTVTLDTIPATASGSGVIAMEGHPRAESVVGSGNFDISVPVRGEVAYFGITDSEAVERRVAVDIETKCDNCHDKLSLHGNNRADNAQLCVICHNPKNTDVGRRPLTAGGIPDVTTTADGKREESIDMKRMIHAIHAGSQDGHGVRENGVKIYGYGGRLHDYSHVRFPGVLNDCTTCHNDDTYELDGDWAAPTANGILGSTVETVPNATDAATFTSGLADQSDDLAISPTAAVCSACHDGALAQAHMVSIGGAQFNVTQVAIDGGVETCSVCHGPGRSADVKLVHGID